jgi:hypothetical protein
MSTRYNKSQDGVERATFVLKVRLDRSDVEKIKKRTAARTHRDMVGVLEGCLYVGVEDLLLNAEDFPLVEEIEEC